MPMYTYRCEENGHEFSVRQRMSDEPLASCQVCGGPVRKVINRVGVVFKGSGFYVTDNRNGSASRTNGSSSTATSSTTSSSSDSSSSSSDSSSGSSDSGSNKTTSTPTADAGSGS